MCGPFGNNCCRKRSESLLRFLFPLYIIFPFRKVLYIAVAAPAYVGAFFKKTFLWYVPEADVPFSRILLGFLYYGAFMFFFCRTLFLTFAKACGIIYSVMRDHFYIFILLALKCWRLFHHSEKKKLKCKQLSITILKNRFECFAVNLSVPDVEHKRCVKQSIVIVQDN